jgi:hypothetical protein
MQRTVSDSGTRYKMKSRVRVGRWRVLTCCRWRNEAPVLIESGAWSDTCKAETEMQRREETRQERQMAVCVQVFHHGSVWSCTWILYHCTGWRPVISHGRDEKEDGKRNGRRIRRSFFFFFFFDDDGWQCMLPSFTIGRW